MLDELSGMSSPLSRNDMAGILEIIHSSLSCDSNHDFLAIILRLQLLLPFEYACGVLMTCPNDGPLVPKSYVQFNTPDEFFLEYRAKGHLQTDSLIREMRRTRRLQSWPDGWRKFGQKKEIISLYKDFSKAEGYLHGSEAISATKNESLFCFSGSSMKRNERNSAIIEYVIPHLHLALSYISDKKPVCADEPLLSVREIEVLNWLKHGKSTWDISTILDISERTVNFHVKNITQKLDVVNRTQAVAVGASLGLIDIDGCRYFWVFRIRNGKVNGIDLSNTTIMYIGDITHSSFQDFIQNGSEGEIYISDTATREQREVLNALAVQSLGGIVMRNVSRTEYVKMDIREEGRSIHIKMPYGEMKQSLTTGGDGKTPVRVENQMLPMLTDVKTCHTHFWRYQGDKRQLDYCDRCGVWADFTFEG